MIDPQKIMQENDPATLDDIRIGMRIVTINTITGEVVVCGQVVGGPWTVRNDRKDDGRPAGRKKLYIWVEQPDGNVKDEIIRAAKLGLCTYPSGDTHPENKTYIVDSP